jgi:hypothetical protein
VTYSFHYMTSELLKLYKELCKVGSYIIPYPNDPKLHLLGIKKPAISNIDDFGLPEVQGHLLFGLLGPENLQPSLPQTELLLRPLAVIQCRGNPPGSNLAEV